ncbi:DNA polymerase III subunit beta [Marinibaculum pumilum]|uniref:Beta sliding clamp n=1 Tax=Marinibaculum pumilum TaxID=1766165 RepID=A0ABV7L9A7_9PROT
MEVVIERAALLNSLNHVQSVVERRNTIPILANVQIEAVEGAVALTATDLDIAVVERQNATIVQDGATTVSAHTLYDIVRKLPDGSEIRLAMKGGEGRLALSAGSSAFKLPCLPKEDFPVMAEGDLATRFSVTAADLKRLIEKARFAISMEETRYYLNGIYLHAAENEGVAVLRAVATDGHRLARVEMPLPDGAGGMPGVIIPRKTVGELVRLLPDGSETVEIALSDTKIRFEFGDVVLLSKLIDGTFPDYERVIPSGNDKVMEVDAALFSKAVDRVSTISSEKSRAVKLALEPNKLVLSATSAEQGSATEDLPTVYDADPIEIGFNARYLIDITDQIDGESARFQIADGAAPALVRDGGDESALYVLMPMRV